MSTLKHNVEDVIKKLEFQIQENRRRTRTLSLSKQYSFNYQSRQRLNTMHQISDHFLLQSLDVQPQQDLQQRKTIVNQRLKLQQRKHHQQLLQDKNLNKKYKTEIQPLISCINSKQLYLNSPPLPIVLKQRKETKKIIKPNNFILI